LQVQVNADHASGKRQIREPSLITAMDAPVNQTVIVIERTLSWLGRCADWPRIGKISIKRRSLSCFSPLLHSPLAQKAL
jgi:hypothetical protein